MAITETSPGFSPPSPQQMAGELATVTEIYPRENGGSFLPTESGLYLPVPGLLEQKEAREIPGGDLYIAAYHSERASHPVGVYVPRGYDIEKPLPTVLMTTPLGTGPKGHNQFVAEEMMHRGFAVVLKAAPRYKRPTLHAVNLTEDANEMFGVLNSVEMAGIIGVTNEIFLYGESQAAMKALGALAIANEYGRDAIDALVVAACFLRKANLKRPDQLIGRSIDMVKGGLRYAKSVDREELQAMRGTFDIKDAHHHLIVLPVLMSGEAGTFLPHIPRLQNFTKELYGQDGHSHPLQVEADLKSRFPNVKTRILHEYGHPDGIKSPKTAALRGAMLFEIAQTYDARVASN